LGTQQEANLIVIAGIADFGEELAIQLEHAIATFLADLAQANRSIYTRQAYATDLKQVVAWHVSLLETLTLERLRAFSIPPKVVHGGSTTNRFRSAGLSLATIRKQLGHKHLQTTLHYAEQSDPVPDAKLRA
jgi:hypothetical protein